MKLNFFRNTACGHNDFCSVRLNGPIWWFILTHKYRLSLSHFTEDVMIESAAGATFAAQKQESPDAKVSCPSGCCRIIEAYRCLGVIGEAIKHSIKQNLTKMFM